MSEHVRTVIAAVRAARRRGNRMSDATRAAIAARESRPEVTDGREAVEGDAGGPPPQGEPSVEPEAAGVETEPEEQVTRKSKSKD